MEKYMLSYTVVTYTNYKCQTDELTTDTMWSSDLRLQVTLKVKKPTHVLTVNFYFTDFQNGSFISIFRGVVFGFYNNIYRWLFAWHTNNMWRQRIVGGVVGVTTDSICRIWLICWWVRGIQIKLSESVLLPIIA